MPASKTKTIVLITGANTGLGFEIAKALFARPASYHVLIGCRGDVSRASHSISELKQIWPNSSSTAEPLSIDITSDESIATAFKQVEQKIGHVDVLVNNAGADFDKAVDSGELTPREGWNETYDVNVTGTHLFTTTFAPLLLRSTQQSPRVLFITSGLASVEEHSTGKSSKYAPATAGEWPKAKTLWIPYRVSKTALNMLAVEWGRLLHNDGIAVFNISPGFLDTGLGDNRDTGEKCDKAVMGAIDPAIGGGFCADVVEGKRDEWAWPMKTMRKDGIQPW